MTARRITIYPVEGRTVRLPSGALIPPEGAEVPRSSYWFRRLRDGDVADEPPKAPAKKKTAKKKKKTKRDK